MTKADAIDQLIKHGCTDVRPLEDGPNWFVAIGQDRPAMLRKLLFVVPPGNRCVPVTITEKEWICGGYGKVRAAAEQALAL